jgi:hypothetical protein
MAEDASRSQTIDDQKVLKIRAFLGLRQKPKRILSNGWAVWLKK